MLESTIRVGLKEGLHARPATEFVKLAGKYSCEINLGKDGKFVDGKSILGLMSLAVPFGQKVTLRTSGMGDEEAMDELVKFLAEEEK